MSISFIRRRSGVNLGRRVTWLLDAFRETVYSDQIRYHAPEAERNEQDAPLPSPDGGQMT